MWAARQDGCPLVTNQGGENYFNREITLPLSVNNCWMSCAFHSYSSFYEGYLYNPQFIPSTGTITSIKFWPKNTGVNDSCKWVCICR